MFFQTHKSPKTFQMYLLKKSGYEDPQFKPMFKDQLYYVYYHSPDNILLCLSYICLPSLNYICSERISDGWVDFILGKKNVSFFLWYSIKIKLLKIFLKSMILWRNALWKMKIVLMHFPGEINNVTKFYVSLPTPDMLVCCVSKEGRWICKKFLFTRCGSSLWKILFWLIIQTFLTQITLK